MDVPIEIFMIGIGVSLALAVFGFIRNPQIPAMLVFGGMFILGFTAITDMLVFGQLLVTVDDSVTPAFVTNVFHYNLGAGNTDIPLNNVAQHATGENVVTTASVLYAKSIQCIEIPLFKTGSPTGNLTVGVMNINGIMVNEFGTMDASTLTTSALPYTFCKPDNFEAVLGVNDRIGVRYNLGSAINFVTARTQTGNPIDGANTVQNSYQVSWVVTGANDVVMRLYDIIPTVVEDNQTYNYECDCIPFTEMAKVLFLLIAVVMMLCGAIMVGRNQ